MRKSLLTHCKQFVEKFKGALKFKCSSSGTFASLINLTKFYE